MYFLGDVNVVINKRPFIINTSHCNMSVKYVEKPSGTGTSLISKKNSILSAIGEMFEREILLSSIIYNNYYQDNIYAYSIVDEAIEKVDKNSIFALEENSYIDSCGLASHLYSEDCIKSSFEEFVERQSFIFSYLTKTPGVIIDLFIEKKYKYLHNLFPNSKYGFYNISLTNAMHVIFGKILFNNKLYIGLGCSTNIDYAIDKCIKEILQCKYYYDVTRDIKNDKEIIDFGFANYDQLFTLLPAERMWNAYSYLDTGQKKFKSSDFKNKDFNIEKISLDLYKKYKMKPLIVYLQNLRFNSRSIKITKVIDKHWFKSLAVKSYKEEDLNFIEGVTNKKIDRRCTYIPFP